MIESVRLKDRKDFLSEISPSALGEGEGEGERQREREREREREVYCNVAESMCLWRGGATLRAWCGCACVRAPARPSEQASNRACVGGWIGQGWAGERKRGNVGHSGMLCGWAGGNQGDEIGPDGGGRDRPGWRGQSRKAYLNSFRLRSSQQSPSRTWTRPTRIAGTRIAWTRIAE